MGRTIDIIETMRLIIWQRLVPSVDGRRVALREYLTFSEKLRDQLLDSDPEQITATTRRLVRDFGQPMRIEVEQKYKEGLISDRIYKVLSSRAKNEDYIPA
jgi:defect-in-organelle-trafficking protein DotB